MAKYMHMTFTTANGGNRTIHIPDPVNLPSAIVNVEANKMIAADIFDVPLVVLRTAKIYTVERRNII